MTRAAGRSRPTARVTRHVATFLPLPSVGLFKAKDEATPNGRGNGSSRTLLCSRGLMITFALADERQRCRSVGCERSAFSDTTMRDYTTLSDEAYRTGGGE